MTDFQTHNGYKRTYKQSKLSLGLIFPLESYAGNIPEMYLAEQIQLAKYVDGNNFAALWVRDVPLNDPHFGDVGQMYDPWIFLSHIAAHTNKIALGTASAITSFVHPITLAKAAASLDKISRDRLLLGLATGDRFVEFDAFKLNREKRAEMFRESLNVMKTVWKTDFPTIQTNRVNLTGTTDILPKPNNANIPSFVTGFCGQDLAWIAKHADGWISYPRNPDQQAKVIADYRSLTSTFKPFTQSLHIDLAEDANEGPTPQHLGFRSGHRFLREFLHALQTAGVNHVIINPKDASRPAREIIQELAEEVVPHFPAF